MPQGIIIVFVLIVLLFLFSAFMSYVPIPLWIQATSSGVSVGLIDLMMMKLRGAPPQKIIGSLIMAHQAKLGIRREELEAHYLAGGNVENVVNALIQAMKANINLDFTRACAIDLAGRDVLEAVNMSVNPKVIKSPLIGAVAKDGVQLKATARITVKADINKLIGGAGEATIIARVGEGICATIGSAESHKRVLEAPGLISEKVLARGLDGGTAYEILSIDIADVDVGRNIGSQLKIEQAEADKQIAQAQAEQRRMLAVAQEQENKASVVEMEAKVIEAESQVPLALASALREGKIGKLE